MVSDIKVNSSNDIDYTERAYQTSEIATMLDIAVPTVRKYAQSLEGKGYVFLKGRGTGKHQARLFVEKDVNALRYLKDIREKGNMTVEQATNIVTERFNGGVIQRVRSNDIQYNEQVDKRHSELKEMVHKQTDLIGELSKKLDQQQNYISESIKERDRVLMQSLNEIMESKKQITAEGKKGFFARLFNK